MNENLKVLLLQKLCNSWQELNKIHFKGRLKKPSFTFEGGDSLVGSFSLPAQIFIHPDVVLYNDWEAVLIPVLKHEMVHQYIFECVDKRDSGHGVLFKKICQQIGAHPMSGIDIARSPLPNEIDHAEVSSEFPSILRKIEKLMNLSRSQNIHEAESAMEKANQLLLKYNLDASSLGKDDNMIRINLGLSTKRTDLATSYIASILCEYYFVDTVFYKAWDEQGFYNFHLAIMGKSHNVKIAEYTFHFLSKLKDQLWVEYLKSEKIKNRRAKREFTHGLFQGFESKLTAQRSKLKNEGLVWKGDPELLKYAKKEFPRTTRRCSSSTSETSKTFRDGQALGKSITVRGAMSRKPNSTNPIRLLN